jgi:hypothetical protein
MTPVLLAHDEAERQSSSSTARLTFKAPGRSTGFVDGAWWPRGNDLAAELPELVSALSGRISALSRVIYHLPSWDSAPNRVGVGERTVRLDGYRFQEVNTVEVVGTDRDRLVLVVIPPSADPASAQATMAAAATADNKSTARELLGTAS